MRRGFFLIVCFGLFSTFAAIANQDPIKTLTDQKGTNESSPAIEELQKTLLSQQAQIALLKQEIEDTRSSEKRSGGEKTIADLQDRVNALEKEKDKFPWEATTFYVSTGLTVVTVGVTIWGIYFAGGAFLAAILPLLNFESRADAIATAKVNELNNVLSGRIQLTIGLILRKLTWNKDYTPSSFYQFGEDAVSAAQNALTFSEQTTRTDFSYLKDFALNNLIFYTTLVEAKNAQDPDCARKVLGLAARLKNVETFKTDAIYINTYSFAHITFYSSLGDGTKASVLGKLSEIDSLLEKSYDDQENGTKSIREETQMLRTKLVTVKATVSAWP